MSRANGGKRWAAILCAALVLGWPLAQVWAWGPAGHMAIAVMAYRQLPPPLQQQVVEILKAHPKYDKWQEKSVNDTPADAAMFTFAKASTWPDELRKSGSPYEHGGWHYIDYPLQSPDFPFIAGLDPDNNILFGLKESEKTLQDSTTTAEQKAAALSWIIHLVGDLHQPLHNAQLVTTDYPPPEGDRGGNKFYVAVGGNPINLHAFWDRLPGQAFSPPYAARIADRLQREFPAANLPELKQPLDATEWSLEGRTLAIDKAYLRGKLIGSADPKALPPPLPPDYLKESKEIADRRLAVASYRLASLLEKILPGVPAESAPAAASPEASSATTPVPVP